MNKKEKLYDAKVRWQETRIKQFSYVNYLILTLSLATLGFAASLAMRDNLFKPEWCAYIFWLYLLSLFLSLFLFLGSIFSGIYCAYMRLQNFQKTARIAKLKYRVRHATTPEVETLRCETKKLDARSWDFLGAQIWLFVVGLGLFSIAVAICQFKLQQ